MGILKLMHSMPLEYQFNFSQRQDFISAKMVKLILRNKVPLLEIIELNSIFIK
jgi:hypothetical protein